MVADNAWKWLVSSRNHGHWGVLYTFENLNFELVIKIFFSITVVRFEMYKIGASVLELIQKNLRKYYGHASISQNFFFF